MQSTQLHPLITPLSTFSRRRKIGVKQRSRPSNLVISLKRDAYDKNHNGRIVDENMIILRMRIHEMKMADDDHESSDDRADWMQWEKNYYKQSYRDDISEGVGLLQVMLMETRPSLALGVLACVLFSVSTSMVAVVFLLIDIARVAIHV